MDRSKTLIAVGVIVVLMGLAQPWLWLYATVTVDTTAPTIGIVVPVNQGTYGSLGKVTISARDATSGVSTVSFYDDRTGSTIGLALETGTMFDGFWSAEISTSWPKDVWIGFRFMVTDNNYNTLEYWGDFMLLNLDGYWEVTDGEATFRSDEANWNRIRFRKRDLTFRFHEDRGDAVSVSVDFSQVREGDATGSVAITRIDQDTFEGNHSFGDGVYNIEMAAGDGINAPIAASIIQIGDVSPFSIIQMSLLALGSFITLTGLYIRR